VSLTNQIVMKTTRQKVLEQQSLNRKIWAKDNGRMHRIDANKLIAEFMQLPTEIFQPRGTMNYGMDDSWYEEHELSYHLSWDWLMPVVDKIENYLSDNVGKVGYFDECLSSNNLEVRYQAVVEFINQLNK